jgi:hypothetical protein
LGDHFGSLVKLWQGLKKQNLANMDEVFKQLIFGNSQITNLADYFFGFKDTKIQIIKIRAKAH